jgi:hypothetical protein
MGVLRFVQQTLGECEDTCFLRQRRAVISCSWLMLRLHAQHWQRGDGSCRQQGVAQLEERVSSTPTGCVGRSAKGGQRGKMSGFHTPHPVTLRRLSEAVRDPSPG